MLENLHQAALQLDYLLPHWLEASKGTGASFTTEVFVFGSESHKHWLAVASSAARTKLDQV